MKNIQPLDTDQMEEFKNRTVLFLIQCQKKKYIHDYFIRMKNCFCNNNRRQSLFELLNIIFEIIPKHEERELQIHIDNLEFCENRIQQEDLANTHSEVIINTLYDFCRSRFFERKL